VCRQERNTALKIMESVFNHYYSIPKRMLSLAGQWPYQEKRAKFFRMSLLTVITFSMIIPQVSLKIYTCCSGSLIINSLIMDKLCKKKLIKI